MFTYITEHKIMSVSNILLKGQVLRDLQTIIMYVVIAVLFYRTPYLIHRHRQTDVIISI